MKEKKELSFEENLNNLEKIVQDLENGNIPLDDAISKFNEAIIYANKCSEKLTNAEESINKIINSDGTLENFEINDK
ncbi:MAG: exodeoxyribonuclease VII small subunit [Tenericutes bacterium]|jgi:exodeoxyribonuclease VII small subunit|nr:exodeoxyribonuclease VII small subunit [Mycoplasmatota bacterium]